ncbi:MAG: CaiB/BaiF CoA transferase family protein, partial [Acidiferrobacterales bacterium]
SITIDLKNDVGHQVAVRMAAVADIVTENFSAGVMARLKLDYETLRAQNPRLIYVSMSGFGHNGPRRDWTSMNMNLQGYSGLMMITGSEGDPPTAISNSWNDYIGGLHACFGILHALSQRATTGTGANLDLSQFECSVAAIGPLLLSSTVNQSEPPRLGNRSAEVAPQGVYRCAGVDEWCAISVQNNEQWNALVKAMGGPEWAKDAHLATLPGRVQHHDEIDVHIEAWTSQIPNADVERHLKAAGVPAERMRRIQTLVGVPDGAQAFERMEEPLMGSVLTTSLPFSFSSSSFSPPYPAPSLGQDTRDVLHDWLDLSDTEIDKLENQAALL